MIDELRFLFRPNIHQSSNQSHLFSILSHIDSYFPSQTTSVNITQNQIAVDMTKVRDAKSIWSDEIHGFCRNEFKIQTEIIPIIDFFQNVKSYCNIDRLTQSNQMPSFHFLFLKFFRHSAFYKHLLLEKYSKIN